ncbi:Nucleoside-diphosphate-sugar epimerase [Anaerocolumna jejuensis DSM 15929]|uniref:Nucleoside-diphosphate-sugar epimerase n=1 Tax=Anaerocolumna jejuensis DSM 15929 TaxID=1121322 RepID=A0A1M6PLE2_9FIRM|nr:SDR family oxidoreductase [Anaerocolumna jejuensis]SHK08769.1 Nucleoside-diphosphate-sugar epimerase [Anaerocolumna jejuensis DSM 15929]
MRIFITGATGFVGSAVAKELMGAGYEVLGLARSDEAVKSLSAAGVQVHKGDLEDLESLRAGAANADGVIHTAFNHDFTKFKDSTETDRRAIEAIGTELAGSGRPFIVTSAIGILPQGHLVSEETEPVTGPHSRGLSEQTVIQFAGKGVRTSVIRLAPSVHGEGDHNFIPNLIRLAKEKGVSAYIGEGSNRWPAVHRFDTAHLYRLILEKGIAGSRYHAVAEESIPFKEIAGAIGRQLNVPVVSLSPEEAGNHFGWFTNFAAMDVPASSQLTREQLGWQPSYPGLLEDISLPHYY